MTRARTKQAKKPKSDQSPSIKSLRAIQRTEVDKYTTVKNTSAAYSGHLARGRAFLAKLVAKHKENGGMDMGGEEIPIDELEKAFDTPAPNRWSAFALELFLVEKCFNENLGSSTADGIQGAFAGLWDNM